ncbi:RAD3/XPD family [Parasponia andersonii]|uniref:DNA 5'-3' helicase FANCJ n=1 Tax=Parasponia andersonii TaxID=3476 RepID=A0A2P5ACM0_PARAD|nr:RAD3/XPD family [Parasponia andersonii]
MVTAIPSRENPSPSPKTDAKKNVYHIGGLPVEFPYKPYGTQLAFMGRVISTLDRAQRDGHCHALLESPTGTGKSLSLLCSTLAWQQSCKLKIQDQSKPDPQAMADPLAHGGGFVPDDEPSSTVESEDSGAAQTRVKNKNKKKKAPTIFYTSRTHSQISQVIREYKKTGYRVPMAILASRKHYCTNPSMRGKYNLDEECKLLLSKGGTRCPEFENEKKVQFHPSLQKGGCHEAHDIEDLVKVGQVVKGCSYYAARSMADSAELVFCPYNYVINPVIRGAMNVNIQGAILVLDEAHNMEDIARDAGSVDIEEEALHKLKAELEGLCEANASVYQPLYEVTQDLLSWIGHRRETLEKREFQHYFSCWTGDKALRELQEANISQQSFPSLLGFATKAIRDASDTKNEVEHLSGMTLSPLNSFSSELGLQFGASLEAPHVIDTDSQVWSAIIPSGQSNFPLNASYKTADGCAFQDALGKSLEEIFKIVPGGCLVFFPSYKLLEKLHKRWCETGQWSHLNTIKSLFLEPRGGSQEDFESVLKGYYDAVHGTAKSYSGRKRTTKKLDFNRFTAIQCAENTNPAGAALFAVFRGKVSEGIDFSDDNARAVIIVGIPFPNINDIQVGLKMKYNDAYKSSKNLLSGSEWYCHQAFRALNQAAGRCIRHRFDYGAIIFLDERYRRERNTASISKWLRKSIREYDNFDSSLEGLESFFSDVKERVSKNMVNVVENSVTSLENIPSTVQSKGSTRKQDQNLNKSDLCRQKEISLTKYNSNTFFPSLKSQDDVELQASVQMEEDADNGPEFIDLSSPQKNSRYPTALSMEFSQEDPEMFMVKETPFPGGSTTIGSPWSFSKTETSASTVIHDFSGVQDQLSSHPFSVSNHNKNSSKAECFIVVTPQKNTAVNTSSSMVEIESSINLSVNSCSLKRRKSISSSPVICLIEEQHDAVDGDASDCTTFIKDSTDNGDANQRADKCAEAKSKSSVPQLLTKNNFTVTSGLVMNKRLLVHCSLCKTALGLPENHQYVTCCLTSSSKIHVESLHRKILKLQNESKSKGIHVLVTDISSVCQQLRKRTLEGGSEHGTWSEKDGCVFNTIFCPFCGTDNNCLGVEVMATNASNIHLLNKILLYVDQLEIKNFEESMNTDSKIRDPLTVSASSMDAVATLNSFDKFSYISQENNSGGWTTAKSKHCVGAAETTKERPTV